MKFLSIFCTRLPFSSPHHPPKTTPNPHPQKKKKIPQQSLRKPNQKNHKISSADVPIISNRNLGLHITVENQIFIFINEAYPGTKVKRSITTTTHHLTIQGNCLRSSLLQIIIIAAINWIRDMDLRVHRRYINCFLQMVNKVNDQWTTRILHNS